MSTLPAVEALRERLAGQGYVCGLDLATAAHLALALERPLFLEGEAGVGKTELARALAAALGRRLIRLQCYEGLDLASAAYDWDYARQMMEVRLAEAAGAVDRERLARAIYSEAFLVERPLLAALRPAPGGPPVLLIDEIDRADEPFEAFLLELLADFRLTIPEIGPIAAERPPLVVLTSNRTREVHDAVKRRCFYCWIDYPDAERELEIVRRRAPGVAERLAREAVAFVQRTRELALFKPPGVAETIDWVRALDALAARELGARLVASTLGVLCKYQDDCERLREAPLGDLIGEARARAGG